MDHATPCPNERIAALHKLIREFCQEQQCVFFDQNYGVCHQVMLEEGLVHEGDLILGGDSHTCSYGAVGAFSTGVGSTELGAAMLTGKTWLMVPKTTRIELTGQLPAGVCAKDVILQIIGDLRSDGVSYESVEFAGDGWKRIYEGKRSPQSVRDVAEPWYTGNFEDTWADVTEGCAGLLEFLQQMYEF